MTERQTDSGVQYCYQLRQCSCELAYEQERMGELAAREKQSRIDFCWGQCNLTGEYRTMRLDREDWHVGQRPMVARACKWLIERTGSVYLVGHNGCGKSNVAAGLVRECCDRGILAFWAGWESFVEDIRLSNKDMDHYITRLSQVEILVWDDFCRTEPTKWCLDVITRVVYNRANNGRPIWFTANWDVDAKLELLIGGGNVSRIGGMCGGDRIEAPRDVPDFRIKDGPWWAE